MYVCIYIYIYIYIHTPGEDPLARGPVLTERKNRARRTRCQDFGFDDYANNNDNDNNDNNDNDNNKVDSDFCLFKTIYSLLHISHETLC